MTEGDSKKEKKVNFKKKLSKREEEKKNENDLKKAICHPITVTYDLL